MRDSVLDINNCKFVYSRKMTIFHALIKNCTSGVHRGNVAGLIRFPHAIKSLKDLDQINSLNNNHFKLSEIEIPYSFKIYLCITIKIQGVENVTKIILFANKSLTATVGVFLLAFRSAHRILIVLLPGNMESAKIQGKSLCDGFRFKELWSKIRQLTYSDIVKYMYHPTDPASLGIIRLLFGLLMLVDLPEERGGSDIDLRWGDPRDCHFPLFPVLHRVSYPYMSLLYFIMWIGACGIMLGYKFRLSVFLFGIPYWYILLIDKSFWNNHSYLFGVVTILLMGSSANHFLSLDGMYDQSRKNTHVPYWNYFILKYQFFMLYFLAGLKKTDMEWLEGYSMSNLGEHWVFRPFQLILSSDKIDYLVVHWFGFILDLTIGFWMLVEFTRPVAMLFCACFHLMNSRLFSIGI
ncbi:hypothetical protein NQ317_015026 [Molorchus minor]|uniref:HTTM-like domain-containing protein n=1 Tax=Molorchus minor TaxID=1323400 RepID=A0ABQ9K652_9CUCU|nr:hypothetical protein NQ317_015026 [Molorchus minor]